MIWGYSAEKAAERLIQNPGPSFAPHPANREYEVKPTCPPIYRAGSKPRSRGRPRPGASPGPASLRTAMISARIEMAISAGVSAPIRAPIGACTAHLSRIKAFLDGLLPEEPRLARAGDKPRVPIRSAENGAQAFQIELMSVRDDHDIGRGGESKRSDCLRVTERIVRTPCGKRLAATNSSRSSTTVTSKSSPAATEATAWPT